MNIILIVLAVVSLTISLIVAQFPNLAKLSEEIREDFDLTSSDSKNLDIAISAGRNYRSWAIYEIRVAAVRTGFSLLILTVGLAVASLVWIEPSASIQDLGLYLGNKVRFVFRVGVTESSMLSDLMSPLADRLIGIAFVAALGSVLAFSAGTLSSFFASWIFPLRWLKWSRLPRYFQGEHNSWLLKKRQFQLILSSKTRVSGPSTGVHEE